MKSLKQNIYLFIVGISLITAVLFTGARDTAGGGEGSNLFSIEEDVSLGAGLVAGLAGLKNSQKDEFEADALISSAGITALLLTIFRFIF